MSDSEISAPPLTLVPVTPEAAARVCAGDLSGLVTGDGWPHEDTTDGLGGVRKGSSAWFVELDGAIIGDCGTHGPWRGQPETEIGYGLAAPYRGHGYGGTMVVALSGWLLAQPGMERVVTEVLVDNAPSRGALEHAGFVLRSEDEQFARYALERASIPGGTQ